MEVIFPAVRTLAQGGDQGQSCQKSAEAQRAPARTRTRQPQSSGSEGSQWPLAPPPLQVEVASPHCEPGFI